MYRGTESLDVYTTDYRIDVWSAFAEHAVTALLHGARVALENACNGDTANMCDAFRNNTQDVSVLELCYLLYMMACKGRSS